jgi:hypothetical protein
MAFSLNLSSLLILVALIFWGWLWGLWGMFLAVPLTASIKIVFENIATLRPLAVLMSELPTAPVDAPGQGDGAVRGAEDVAARRPEGTNPGDQPVSPL